MSRRTIIQQRESVEPRNECNTDSASCRSCCLAGWSLFRLREETCDAGPAVFGHARDCVYVRARLEGGVEAHAVHLIEQSFGEDDRSAADFLEGRDVALDRLLEVFVGEDAVNESDALGLVG